MKESRERLPKAPKGTVEAKRTAAMLLSVMAGTRTVPEAAEGLGISVNHYYNLEARAIQGLVDGCEKKPKGREADPRIEAKRLEKELEQLRRELRRSETLLRTSTRTLGLPSIPDREKKPGEKRKKRKPMVRALRRVDALLTGGDEGAEGTPETPAEE